MIKIIAIMIILTIVNAACHPHKAQTAIILPKQGIVGTVLQLTGNRMPAKNAKPILPRGISAEVYVYQKTNITQTERFGGGATYSAIHTRQITSITTDSAGKFMVLLPVGSYSLFIKKQNRYYANSFDANNNINVVVVDRDKLTNVTLMDTEGATF